LFNLRRNEGIPFVNPHKTRRIKNRKINRFAGIGYWLLHTSIGRKFNFVIVDRISSLCASETIDDDSPWLPKNVDECKNRDNNGNDSIGEAKSHCTRYEVLRKQQGDPT
jgi:hypothetical protein